MFWINLLFVFLFALLLGSILSWGFGWRHPARSDAVGASFLFLFLILLLAMWAGGVWFVPWGPALGGRCLVCPLGAGILWHTLVGAPPYRPLCFITHTGRYGIGEEAAGTLRLGSTGTRRIYRGNNVRLFFLAPFHWIAGCHCCRLFRVIGSL